MEYDGRLHAVELSHLSIQDYSETFYFKCMYIYIYFFFLSFLPCGAAHEENPADPPKDCEGTPIRKGCKVQQLGVKHIICVYIIIMHYITLYGVAVCYIALYLIISFVPV